MGFAAPGGRAEEDRIILPPETIQRIVDILAATYPLGNDRTRFIIQPYLDGGFATNYGLDLIEAAVKDELGVEYLAIADNEDEIIVAYANKIGYPHLKALP